MKGKKRKVGKDPPTPHAPRCVTKTEAVVCGIGRLSLIHICVDHKSKKLGKQVWETQITSRGTSSDFRNVLPILIEVLKKDIATNTKGKIQYSVEIKENEKNPQMKITIEKDVYKRQT